MEVDKFYLEKIFPESDKIFHFHNKTSEDLKDTCIYILDTNILLVPYLTSKESVQDFAKILRNLKSKKRIYIPERVAREFAKNRDRKVAETYDKIVESKNRLNKAEIRMDKFPIFESNAEYIRLKEIETEINKLKTEFTHKLDALSEGLMNWTWNDPVSKVYEEIFTNDIIVKTDKTEAELIDDQKFRNEHSIPPGFKKSDQQKPDGGIGDLIIWRTTLQIGKERASDIIFVTNEEHTDWFYRVQKTAILPRYELLDEYRRFTNGKNINIINFSKFLTIQNASNTTVQEIEELRSIEQPGNLKIIAAEYCTPTSSYDATAKLQSLILFDSLATIANNDLVGDPETGSYKKVNNRLWI
jgi:predicted nucleic acid-binding protein